jgi:hypothetical protein
MLPRLALLARFTRRPRRLHLRLASVRLALPGRCALAPLAAAALRAFDLPFAASAPFVAARRLRGAFLSIGPRSLFVATATVLAVASLLFVARAAFVAACVTASIAMVAASVAT